MRRIPEQRIALLEQRDHVLQALEPLEAADDWLGFTHAYFPARVFDEHAFQGGWAFARTGDGYLALTAARGFEFITTGPTAYRELRSAIFDLHAQEQWIDVSAGVDEVVDAIAPTLGFRPSVDVTLIDEETNPGGVCLYRGCIPSKALLHVARVIHEAEEA